MSFTVGTIQAASTITHITGGKSEVNESTTWDVRISKELFACIVYEDISMFPCFYIQGKTGRIIIYVSEYKMLNAVSK